MRILFVGDVFGLPGRRAVESRLPGLREELGVDFCIVNGENAAEGRGITAKIAERLLASGADVVTLGNWAWGQRGFAPYLSGTDRVLRPANLSPSSPGVGLAVHDGVAVVNLLGQMTLNPFESPFLTADRLGRRRPRAETPVIVVDFHAEATSEKVAMAYYLAGRVTAVFGTHTHVQTNDARVLAGGTAAVTDAGMTGPHDSVIGSKVEGPIRRFTTGFPTRLEVADGDVRIEGVLVECGADGRATSCELVRVRSSSRAAPRLRPRIRLAQAGTSALANDSGSATAAAGASADRGARSAKATKGKNHGR